MIRTLLCGLALILAATGSALAAPLFNRPLYNEETKSYFELVDGSYMDYGHGPNWGEALEMAAQRYYGNTQGRLAIIPSAKTEMFVRLNLRPDVNMWFGLYYDCASQTLNWVDGRQLRSGDYVNWGPSNWYIGHAGGFCHAPNGDPRMPALIAMSEVERNWVLQMPAKRYHLYLVEYPTGGPLDGKAAVRKAPDGAPVPAAAKPEPVQAKAAEKPADVATPVAPAQDQPVAVDNAASPEALKTLPPGAGMPTLDAVEAAQKEK